MYFSVVGRGVLQCDGMYFSMMGWGCTSVWWGEVYFSVVGLVSVERRANWYGYLKAMCGVVGCTSVWWVYFSVVGRVYFSVVGGVYFSVVGGVYFSVVGGVYFSVVRCTSVWWGVLQCGGERCTSVWWERCTSVWWVRCTSMWWERCTAVC